VRADRLVSVLLLLQRRGHVTAAEVAEELEISERTARRDLEALSIAGLPVYSRQGRGGGWELLGGARTDLSGLTGPEATALFMVAGPSSSATPEVKRALRKLVRALPEPFRDEAEAATTAIVIDPNGWGRAARPMAQPSQLEAVKQAVVAARQVALSYVDRESAATERLVDPLGLASKGSQWYLVAGTPNGMRSFRVDRIRSIEPMAEPVKRPPGFDLEATWAAMNAAVEDRRTPFLATATIARTHLGILRGVLGGRVRVIEEGVGENALGGRFMIELRSRSAEVLAVEIAGFVQWLTIIEPADVRESLARIGVALAERYR
jgi:predicted DNA-binding transcriptional regulator YafY